MQNRNCKTANPLLHSQSSQKLKFKELPREFNELNSKYELYKRGTPNSYSEDMEALKAKTIRNDVSILELAGIQYIINQISQSDKEKQVNQRNYDLYPTLLTKPNVRYKDMLSQKQEIRDFILWFEAQYQTIQQSTDSLSKKFHHKQTLIAAGFTEMTAQIAKVSKNRSEILKMLWNRQNSQVTSIVESINDQNLKKEKEMLQSISSVHRSYQDEIEGLRIENKQLQEESKREKEFGKSCVCNLRVLRRRIKKIEYMLKKLGESNLTLKRENLNLLEENIKLLMNVKEVRQEEAVILNYRKLQIYQQKHKLNQQQNKQLIKLTHSQDNPIQDFQHKKNSLYEFFIQRITQNPDERVMIKEEYFTEEENEDNATIEDYFKNVINRPNVQVELLTQVLTESIAKDQAVNTDSIEQKKVQQPILLFQKGIQVQLQFHQRESKGFQRRYYQIMDQREEQLIDKESKKRIIQHRQSRKNSLTLLELERLNELQSKPVLKAVYQKHNNHPTSGFSKKTRKESKVQNQSLDQEDHIQQSSSSEDNIHISEGTSRGQSSALRILSNLQSDRKSKEFSQILHKISHNQQKSKGLINDQVLRLEGEEHIFTYSELQDLIEKHLAKSQQGKSLRNPEKSLNKVMLGLFRSVSRHSPSCFMFALLQVIKTSYGNIKSVMWKFLTIVSNIHRHQSSNSLLKVAALLLKVSDKFKMYNQVNGSQIGELYFRLFFLLSIKGVTESSFNLWKACTSLQKIKGSDFLKVLQLFFSQKKHHYIENKVKEFIAASQGSNLAGHGEATRTPVEQAQIVKLNPLLLYIMQVYLIEKQLFHASYSIMVDFLGEERAIPSEIIVWFINLLGFDQQSQKQMFSFVLRTGQQTQKQTTAFCKADMFYRCCVRFDFPLMEQVEVWTYRQFKQLPTDVQQKYFRMIGMQEWTCLKEELIISYRRECESAVYLKAFEMVAEKLQSQICRGASIYGQQGQKRKQQVFSLFYKILIVQAHRHHLHSGSLRGCIS